VSPLSTLRPSGSFAGFSLVWNLERRLRLLGSCPYCSLPRIHQKRGLIAGSAGELGTDHEHLETSTASLRPEVGTAEQSPSGPFPSVRLAQIFDDPCRARCWPGLSWELIHINSCPICPALPSPRRHTSRNRSVCWPFRCLCSVLSSHHSRWQPRSVTAMSA
jgi:hypothetical protein